MKEWVREGAEGSGENELVKMNEWLNWIKSEFVNISNELMNDWLNIWIKYRCIFSKLNEWMKIKDEWQSDKMNNNIK